MTSLLKMAEPTPAPPPVASGLNDMRDFGDASAVRKAIYAQTLDAARSISPVQNTRYQLSLGDIDYEDPEDYPIARQKEAILKGESIGRRLRGTWTLNDLQGNPIEKKRSTLAVVPYMTPRGTFIINGVEQTLAHQMRLRP